MDLTATAPELDLASTKYCLANPGVEYLVYQPESGGFSVELAAGMYSYEWFNPVTGTKAAAGSIAAEGGRKYFNAPFSGDALLYLKKD